MATSLIFTDRLASAVLVLIADYGKTHGCRRARIDPKTVDKWAETSLTDPESPEALFRIRARTRKPDEDAIELIGFDAALRDAKDIRGDRFEERIEACGIQQTKEGKDIDRGDWKRWYQLAHLHDPERFPSERRDINVNGKLDLTLTRYDEIISQVRKERGIIDDPDGDK